MTQRIFKITLCFVALGFLACGGKTNAVRDAARESLDVNAPAIQSPTTPTAPPTAQAGAPGVLHYICPKNCEGSGGSAAGTCSNCGSDYVHNQAYHGQQQQPASGSSDGNAIDKITFPGSTNSTPGTTPPPTPDPPQNAAGVWHYTCANGHEGGAGSAGTCATCGGPLSHNSAYHQ